MSAYNVSIVVQCSPLLTIDTEAAAVWRFFHMTKIKHYQQAIRAQCVHVERIQS